MKKRAGLLLLLIILFAGLFSVTAYADMGPKPSVNLKIYGFSDVEYYVTLLSEDTTTGPYSVYDPSYSEIPTENGDIWQKFQDYQDEDGYYFLQYFEKVEICEDRNGEYGAFSWSYYPPNRFKVLLYFPETDAFVVSQQKIDTYAFDSYFEVTAGEADTGCNVERSYGYGWEVFAFLVRLVLTILIELLIALIFGVRSRKLLTVILIANGITQLALNISFVIMGYMSMFFFYALTYGLVELIIFVVEGTAYDRAIERFGEGDTLHPYLYSLTANLCSFVLGYVISHWFPFVF